MLSTVALTAFMSVCFANIVLWRPTGQIYRIASRWSPRFYPFVLTTECVFQKWTGDFFTDIMLHDLGARYQLGHRPGERCPVPSPIVDLMLFDITGVTTVRIQYCYCGEPGKQQPPRTQLLRKRWVPATLKQPGTAFTFRLLNFIHKLQTRSKVSLYDFYATLISIPDASGLRPPIVSMCSSSTVRAVDTIIVSLQRTFICLPYLGRPTACSSWGWSPH